MDTEADIEAQLPRPLKGGETESSSSISLSHTPSKKLLQANNGLYVTFDGVNVVYPLPRSAVNASRNEASAGSATPPPPKERVLLNNIKGSIVPGVVTAVMGPSGSGKTTLLTTLARRFEPTLKYTGSVRYGGTKWSSALKKVVAFVPQDDLVPAGLTVREHLEFSARLRLSGLTEEQRKARVMTVVEQMKLQKCLDTPLGGNGMRGVSGGERKRACIANELLTAPRLLFLDEATSGLDSSLAMVVVDIIHDLAHINGLSVMMTVHQPSSLMMNRFDTLYVMDGGNIFYRGPTSDLANWLDTRLGRPVSQHLSPIEFAMDLIVRSDPEFRNDPRVHSATSEFKTFVETEYLPIKDETSTDNNNSPENAEGDKMSSSKRNGLVASPSVIFTPEAGEAHHDDDAIEFKVNEGASTWTQINVLTQRMWRAKRFDLFRKETVLSEFGLALIAALLWWQTPHVSDNIFSLTACVFWIIGTDVYLGLFASVFALHEETPLIRKELFDGSYTSFSHFIAKNLVIMPQSIIWSIFFVTVVLACTGLVGVRALDAFLLALVCQLTIFVMQSLGLLISASVPASSILVVSVVSVTFYFAFSGFFSLPSSMRPGLAWIRWLDGFTYLFQLGARLVWPEDLTIPCSSVGTADFCPTTNSTLTGTQILNRFEIDAALYVTVIVPIIGSLLMRVVAFILFERRMRPPVGNKNQVESSSTITNNNNAVAEDKIDDDDASKTHEESNTPNVVQPA